MSSITVHLRQHWHVIKSGMTQHSQSYAATTIKPSEEIYADLAGYKSIGDIFTKLRPDIAIVTGNTIAVCELTIAHETNVIKSRNYMMSKYANLTNELTEVYTNYTHTMCTVEFTTLGVLPDPSTLENISATSFPHSVYTKLVQSVIGNFIYRNHNNSS